MISRSKIKSQDKGYGTIEAYIMNNLCIAFAFGEVNIDIFVIKNDYRYILI